MRANLKSIDALYKAIYSQFNNDERFGLMELECTKSFYSGLLADVADEISQRFAQLPVDSNQVPIHPGDYVEGLEVVQHVRVSGIVSCVYIVLSDNNCEQAVRIQTSAGSEANVLACTCRHLDKAEESTVDILMNYVEEFKRCGEDERMQLTTATLEKIRDAVSS